MISIVIPVYNEEDSIGSCLRSLVLQKTKHKFEVIVVDNNSTDHTSQRIKKYKSKLNLKILHEKTQGRGIARDTGTRAAKSEIILSTDADSEVPPNWIDEMVAAFSDEKVIAVTGKWYVEDAGGFTKFFLNNFQMIMMIPYLATHGHYWLTGFNFGIRKSIYIKAGGFDTKLNMHEDIDLTRRIRRFGNIKYIKSALVKTSARRYSRGLLRGLFEYEKEGIKFFVFKNKRVFLDSKRD